jgi:hypothetical protein
MPCLVVDASFRRSPGGTRVHLRLPVLVPALAFTTPPPAASDLALVASDVAAATAPVPVALAVRSANPFG